MYAVHKKIKYRIGEHYEKIKEIVYMTQFLSTRKVRLQTVLVRVTSVEKIQFEKANSMKLFQRIVRTFKRRKKFFL